MKESPKRGPARQSSIVEAALELFVARGFDATLDEVVHAAGASKQTIYRFFGDRDGLLRATLVMSSERVMGPLGAAVAGDGAPLVQLRRFGAAYQQVLFSPRCLQMCRFVIGSVDERPAFGDAFTELVLDPIVEMVTPLVGAATGTSGAAAAVRVDEFLGLLQGNEFNRAMVGAPPRSDRLESLLDSAVAAMAIESRRARGEH